jgi:hypothetical protein
MASKIISSFFTINSIPALGLSPTIRIWSVTPITQTLLIIDAPMLEIGDGFYKYEFTTYDSSLNYVFRSDGGASLPLGERYQTASNESFSEDIVESVWDANKIDHLTPGTFGEAINSIDADVEQLRLDVISMTTLIQLLIKHECNRTRIDKIAKTLTVFDDDGITPIKVFDLFDSTGTPSVDEVCERVPQ